MKELSGSTDTVQSLMPKSFKDCSKPTNLTNCGTETKNNLEESQKYLSMDVVTGFGNPASHETKKYIQ